MNSNNDAAIGAAQSVADFENYVNPALADVLRFIGFTGVESHARGCLVWDTEGREYLTNSKTTGK